MKAEITDSSGGVDLDKARAKGSAILDHADRYPEEAARDLAALIDTIADIAYADGYHDGQRGAYRTFTD